MASLTTAARTFARIARAGLAAATEALVIDETPAAGVERTAAPVIEVPAPSAPTVDLFAVLGAFADETDDMEARFTAAATGTPVEAPKLAEAVELAENVKPAPAREFLPVDQLPAVDVIEAEALAFDKAADKYRAGDRGKNRARKLLDKVPAGRYGRAIVEWIPSNTDRVDLDAVEAIFAAHKLGPVPMKRDRDSLKVTILPA